MPALPAINRANQITFEPASAGDFEALLAIRIAAMRESLERIGRFDPARARERLLSSFDPASTRWIRLDGENTGFYVFRQASDGYHLDHIYIDPPHQGRGIGAFVLSHLISTASEQRLPIYVSALVGSDSNRFYQRHGFVKLREEQWDVYYIRPCD